MNINWTIFLPGLWLWTFFSLTFWRWRCLWKKYLKYWQASFSKGTSPNCFCEQYLSYRLSVIFDSTLFFYWFFTISHSMYASVQIIKKFMFHDLVWYTKEINLPSQVLFVEGLIENHILVVKCSKLVVGRWATTSIRYSQAER